MRRCLELNLLSRLLKYTLGICAISYIFVYLLVALNHISYPYELEWMEGNSVDHVLRLLSGKPLYVEPSLEFIPSIYTPLYFYFSALSSMLFGIGFLPLRLVSFLASIGCFALLFEFVRRETKSMFFGLLSAGLFAATYKVSGLWFDIARVDSLFLLLLLSSIFLLRFFDDAKSLFFSGLLISLCFLTKQTGLVIAVAMSFYCIICLPKWFKLIYPATVFLIIGISTFVLNWVSNGWYYYYVFKLPKEMYIFKLRLVNFWFNDINNLPAAFVISLVYIIFLLFKERRKKFFFYSFFFASMIIASWLPRLRAGGYDNVLIPAFAVMSIFFGLGAHLLTLSSMTSSSKNKETTWLKAGIWLEYFVLLVCINQFTLLYYNPLAQLPSEKDLNAGHAFIQMMKNIEGEIFIPFHGFLSYMAGKKTYAHAMAIGEVLGSQDKEIKEGLWKQIVDAIHSKKFEAIILDSNWWDLEKEIKQDYTLKRRVFNNKDVFWPLTGLRIRPEGFYELRK